MKISFRTQIAILALSLISAAAPLRSQAAVGLLISAITKDSDTKSLGYALAGIGGLTALVGTTAGPEVPNCTGPVTCSCSGNTCTMIGYGTMAPGPSANGTVVTIGLVLLGTSVSPQIEFQELSPASDTDFKINETQRKAFNKERVKINLIAGSMTSILKAEILSGMSETRVLRDSANLWETQGQPVLSADAYAAATQVSAAYVQSWSQE